MRRQPVNPKDMHEYIFDATLLALQCDPTQNCFFASLSLLRSASGKSTLLRLIAGVERPSGGRVTVNGRASSSSESLPGGPPWASMGAPPALDDVVVGGDDDGRRDSVQPVILRGKPDFDDSLTAAERIHRVGLDTVARCSDSRTGGEKALRPPRAVGANDGGRSNRTSSSAAAPPLLETLAGDFASILLSREQRASRPSGLSPSGQHLLGIACGCMMSVSNSMAMRNNNAADVDAGACDGVRYPILLLDELFDAEHPDTVEKCRNGLLDLIERGGVVISATHRPRYFASMRSRTVTLSGGRVLAVDSSGARFS